MRESVSKKTSKIKTKPTVIDFLIVIIVLGALIGIVFRTGVVEKVISTNSQQKAEISFVVFNINGESGNYFNQGDVFTDVTHNCLFGKLKDGFSIMDAETFVEDINGNLIKTTAINGRKDVRATVEATGVFTDEGFLLGGTTYLAPGSYIQIKSQGISVSATITEIQSVQ